MKWVTLCIPTAGTPSLPIVLSAVAHQTRLPVRVLLRFGGDAQANGFYVSRALEHLRIKGVPVDYFFGSAPGPSAAREELVLKADTTFVWFLDDDVVPEPTCLQNFLAHADAASETIAWQGTKYDTANLRGYPDWSDAPRTPTSASCNFVPTAEAEGVLPFQTLDTGNFLLNRRLFLQSSLSFRLATIAPVTALPACETAPAEDLFFALYAQRRGLTIQYVPSAVSAHYEKPQTRFGSQVCQKAFDAITQCLFNNQETPSASPTA